MLDVDCQIHALADGFGNPSGASAGTKTSEV